MKPVLALTGGVGGAKLALGLAHVLPPEALQFVVNTGDDFEHLGLHICPDIDTLTYTLSNEANKETGWGRAGESWNFMDALAGFGGETWFNLGDKDLALHITRTQLLRGGATLTEATRAITRKLGIEHDVLPMSDDPVRTVVHSDAGNLAFQHYFVRDRCKPKVSGFFFRGLEDARPNPRLLDILGDCRAVIICPSNPFVSVDPILKLPGLREALRASGTPVIAVSPIVGGIAIKGPTAKMMAELDVPATAAQVASHYGDLLTGFVLDEQDAALDNQLPVTTAVAQTVMRTLDDRIRLAEFTLAFADRLGGLI